MPTCRGVTGWRPGDRSRQVERACSRVASANSLALRSHFGSDFFPNRSFRPANGACVDAAPAEWRQVLRRRPRAAAGAHYRGSTGTTIPSCCRPAGCCRGCGPDDGLSARAHSMRELPRAATTDPRVKLQRPFPVALRALIGGAARIGHDAIQFLRVTRLHSNATFLEKIKAASTTKATASRTSNVACPIHTATIPDRSSLRWRNEVRGRTARDAGAQG